MFEKCYTPLVSVPVKRPAQLRQVVKYPVVT